jgi:hypothetical protein
MVGAVEQLRPRVTCGCSTLLKGTETHYDCGAGCLLCWPAATLRRPRLADVCTVLHLANNVVEPPPFLQAGERQQSLLITAPSSRLGHHAMAVPTGAQSLALASGCGFGVYFSKLVCVLLHVQ